MEKMDAAFLIQMAGALVSLLLLIHRANQIDRATRWEVRSHCAVTFFAVIFSCAVDHKWSAPILLAGTVACLLISEVRWRAGPPPGTRVHNDR